MTLKVIDQAVVISGTTVMLAVRFTLLVRSSMLNEEMHQFRNWDGANRRA